MLQRCQLRPRFIAALAAMLLALPICAHAGSSPKVQVDENGIATSASATVGECSADLGCGD